MAGQILPAVIKFFVQRDCVHQAIILSEAKARVQLNQRTWIRAWLGGPTNQNLWWPDHASDHLSSIHLVTNAAVAYS